jgi:hypothetical protein
MGKFSTRNSDGASGRGEPVNTVPARASRWIDRDAERHGCDRHEFLTVPRIFDSSNGITAEFDPRRAGEN